MAELTDLDRKLVAALRRDARMSYSDLAVSLGVTRTTVRNRVERLETAGVILGYRAVLGQDLVQHAVRGLMMLGIEGRGAERITRALTGMPEVQAVHSTNGRWDLIVELGTDTLETLDAVLARIRKLDGVSTSETNLLLATRGAQRAR